MKLEAELEEIVAVESQFGDGNDVHGPSAADRTQNQGAEGMTGEPYFT